MKLSSTINKTWCFSALLSLSGFVILLFLLNQTHQKVSFLAPLIEHLELDPSSSATVVKPSKPDPSNVTVIVPLEPKSLISEPSNMESSNATIAKSLEPQPLNGTIVESLESKPSSNDTFFKPLEQEPLNVTVIEPMKDEKGIRKRCNMFEGRWVYKPAEEVPIYDAAGCPFVDEQVNCRRNGRPDSDYERWRWEARDCDVPLFDGKDMLERLRNKRLIIVGDSLNRNQWESLACLLYFSIDPSRAQIDTKGSIKFLKAEDYNCSVEFHWSPLLVDLDIKHKNGRKVLVLDKISSSAQRWRGAHVMVFNSAHWWTHPNSIKAWDVFRYKGQLIEEMPREAAYEKGMRTWAKWLENNVDPKQTKIFFRSISPSHFGKQYCYNTTQPINNNGSYLNHMDKSLVEVIKGKIQGMSKMQVKYLNITNLSMYRRDAHPSVYRATLLKSNSEEILRSTKSDCSHWCLPGLPDTWNRLLYASLVSDALIDVN